MTGISNYIAADKLIEHEGDSDASSTTLPDLTNISLNVRNLQLRNAEDLREAVHGSDLKIIQLASGTFAGHLMHAQIGELVLSTGDFGADIRARGVMNAHSVTIGMMLESSGEVSQWDYDIVPGDVIVFPKSVEQEGRFTGHSRYATITLSEDALATYAAGEPELQDPQFWTKINRFQSSPALRAFVCREIAQKISQLQNALIPDSGAGRRYFQHSIIEVFLAGIVDDKSSGGHEPYRQAAKLVRDVEDYVDSLGCERPVHICELCAALVVSRRTLHRAFHDALGLGPVSYLRLRRLSAVHHALSATRSPQCSVTQVALEYGFADLGRFAASYQSVFGELPSQTRNRCMIA